MQNSRDRILTTHVGSLPRPDDLIELNRAHAAGEPHDEAAMLARRASAVAEVVRQQRLAGIDIPNDGEFGKATEHRINFGAWWSYIYPRWGGLRPGGDMMHAQPRRSAPGRVVLSSFSDRRDRQLFAAAYADPESGVSTAPRGAGGSASGGMMLPVCVGPITYTGQDIIATDIAHARAALDAAGVSEGFLTAIAPGSCGRIPNEYYASEEELMFACAEAMRVEYQAIIDAGFVLQLDDPALATSWDMINPEPSVADYRAFAELRVEALNHALRGLPADRIRYHLCWGSWHGPHVTDIPMRDLIDIVLKVNAQGISFEAGNVRHEHEWKVWRDVKLADGKLLVPGVVSHATNVVEHPELIADRLVRFANVVGRENVLASTDCGLGGRVHPDIAWAKLHTLAEGAALASKQLWG
jgi:5-methyltetrahydropteroyltriglutamate--homocysteine methyltransferase